jgi:hypothetical protein
MSVTLQFVSGKASIVQVSEREVARETPAALVHLVEVGADETEHVGRRQECALGCRWLGPWSAGCDPRTEQGDVVLAGPDLFVGGRHRVVGMDQPLVQPGFVGDAGQNLAPLDELVAIEDIVEPAFVGAVLTMAAVAVLLKKRTGFIGQFLLSPTNSRSHEKDQNAPERQASGERPWAHRHLPERNRQRTGRMAAHQERGAAVLMIPRRAVYSRKTPGRVPRRWRWYAAGDAGGRTKPQPIADQACRHHNRTAKMWALQQATDEEVVAGLKDMRENGGTELGDVIQKLKQKRRDRERTNT